MSNFTNRVYLPATAQEWAADNNQIYCSDDSAGDQRLYQLHKKYGNLNIEICDKRSGNSLNALKAIWGGTIEDYFNSGGIYLEDNKELEDTE